MNYIYLKDAISHLEVKNKQATCIFQNFINQNKHYQELNESIISEGNTYNQKSVETSFTCQLKNEFQNPDFKNVFQALDISVYSPSSLVYDVTSPILRACPPLRNAFTCEYELDIDISEIQAPLQPSDFL
ncbi:Hypothetical_protein [Hexamita inflata]|uniref:Hypothetical_protein n=1 Tax=Hexamita inflata TaxID=28002 RepID=A0AA86QAH3_9EUKA|nr:Hypothetical protein HINF_LOCUS43204 [Hexamita inflata]CAI9963867.1 Hypothetical protein HINF_LOCUS51512 [Hexamita inflata]